MKCHFSKRTHASSPPSPIRAFVTITALLRLPKSHSFSFPSTPKHDLTGEFLVQNQLAQYQSSNLSKVYELCSPFFKEEIGSLSDFKEAINKPPYNLLLGHERADIMLETLPDTSSRDEDGLNAACYLVFIKPGMHAASRFPVWFWWEVSRHYLEEGDDEGEWKVDCVVPDFDDLEFEAENLAQFLEFGDDDELTFLMDVDEDDDE